MNKTKTLAIAFESGWSGNAEDIKRVFGLKNPAEAVRQLRSKGYCIYTNRDRYRLGKPTKAMVAALSMVYGATPFIKK